MIQNFIAHLNGYRERRKRIPLNTNEIALYFILMEYDNELGWMDWFSVANGVLQGLSGLSLSALKRARAELTRKGYIRYRSGSGNQSGRYLIVNFGPQSEPQTKPQTEPQMSHKVDTLTKQKQKQKVKETPYGVKKSPEESVRESVSTSHTESPVRHRYGEYGWVRLSDREYARLVTDYSEDFVKAYITIVDEYVQSTGNKHKYKDWNMVVRRAIKDQWGHGPRWQDAKPQQAEKPTDTVLKPDTNKRRLSALKNPEDVWNMLDN